MARPIKMKYNEYLKSIETPNAMQGDARYQAPSKVNPNSIYEKSTGHPGSPSAAKLAELNGSKNPYITANEYADSGLYKNNLNELYQKYDDLSAKRKPSGGGYAGYSYSPISFSPLSNISAFSPSQEYLDAMAYTQKLLDKINSGKTSYSDKVDEMMDKIANRDKFSYDFETDPLFQNALASSMAAGQTAMENTIGAASGLTGGYGSSYATSAGNQAYNNYVKEAYSQLPEYYKLALDAYEREGNEMYNQLGMYRSADDTEYNRNYNAYNANYQQAQDMYNREYNNYWDTANANLQIDKYNNDAAMDAAQFNASQALSAAKFNYQKQQDALDRASAGSSTTSSGSSTISDSAWKNIKSEGAKIAEKYGVDSTAYAEWIQLQESLNGGSFTDDQIRDLYSYADANAPATQLTLQNKNGNYVYTDQYGKPYQGADRTLVKTKTASNKANNEYTDAYGNTYTESQLKAIYGDKWQDHVK